MATWSDWATPDGTNIQRYDFLFLAWLALDEKHKAKGGRYPSLTAFVWDSGTVNGVELLAGGDVRFTMATTQTWAVGASACYPAGTQRWVNYTPVGGSGCNCPPTFIPSSYDIVIEADDRDTRTSVRGRIVAQTIDGTTGTVTVSGRGFRDAVTAGFITSLSALVGKRYAFVKSGGPLRLDRLPQRPNDPELWAGSAVAGDSTLTVTPSPGWATDQWAGKQVMTYGAEGLRRLTVVRNDGNTLYLPTQSGLTGGVIAIIEPGAKVEPGRTPWRWTQWYCGSSVRQAGHTPGDTLAGANVPNFNEVYAEGNPCSMNGECKDYGHPVFDVDWQIPFDSNALCTPGRAGDLINPELHKSIRQLQKEIGYVAPEFIKRGWSAGTDPPNRYTDATLFADAGINHAASTVQWQPPEGTAAGYYYFNAQAQYAGHAVYYTTRTANGANDASGRQTVGPDARVRIAEYPYPPPAGVTPNAVNSPVGRSVIYSAGRTRYRPRAFKYHREQTCFVPDLRPLDEGGGVYDPPEVGTDDNGHYDCGGRGTWVTRPASTGGIVVGDDGVVYDSAEPFVTGELYRCWGDDFADFPGGELDDVLLPYEDRFYRGRLSRPNQSARDASRSGRITAGTRYSFTDSTKDWHADHANGGTLRTESGTATAGGTTFLTDASKVTTDPTLPHSCWFNPTRYAVAPYLNFILQVDHDGVTTNVPITGFTDLGAAGVRFEFEAVPGFTVHPGDTWRIAEPRYTLNKWRHCDVTITRDDGTSFTVVAEQNDASTIYFEAQPFAVLEGWTYTIQERGYGGVWEWDGTKMVKPTGMDAVRVGVQVPALFHDDPTENRESFVKDYGVVRYGDCLDAAVVFKEIFDTLNLLKDWTTTMTWTARHDPAVEELNYASRGGFYDYGTINYFATQADKAMTAGLGEWAGGNRDVWTDSVWNREFSCNRLDVPGCYGVREQMFDQGDVTPNLIEADVPPQRQFAFNGGMFAEHGLDPSGQYPNQPWMVVRGTGMVIDTAVAAYAYGKTTGVPTLLDATVDMYVYCAIDTADHDEGHTITNDPNDGRPYYSTKTWRDETYTFDAGNTPAAYRQWALYHSAAVDGGSVVGPQFGETDEFDSLNGHFEGCGDGSGTCHLVSDFPTEFAPPQDSATQVGQLDHAIGTQYAWFKIEYRGFVVQQQVAVVRPVMEFIV